MTLKETLITLALLDDLKNVGGERFNEITKLLNMEATTHNMEEANNYLRRLNEVRDIIQDIL